MKKIHIECYRLAHTALILTSLCGYLEWGNNQQHTFLFAAEWDVLTAIMLDPLSMIHPLVILPLIGQILLLIGIMRKQPSRRLTVAGIFCISSLLGVMLVVGVISMNIKILLSVLPFVATSIIAVVVGKNTL